MMRRQALWALGGLCLVGEAHAAARELPLSSSLPDELAGALAVRQPLVVMISLHGCPWCKLVRESYLAPMREQEGLHAVQIDMQSQRSTRALSGAAITHGALVREWGVKFAPTVLFFGPEGKEVAERLVGGSPDFYSAYLDQRLKQAQRVMGP
ncbi:MAG: thioredoxin fold domain-containing protein [Ottowia sp.]|uniref:thioredoxin fold domain-containing protein n=1 Tax=unclassified Ottowia TaxID=2645081 RepID=UPI003C2F7540